MPKSARLTCVIQLSALSCLSRDQFNTVEELSNFAHTADESKIPCHAVVEDVSPLICYATNQITNHVKTMKNGFRPSATGIFAMPVSYDIGAECLRVTHRPSYMCSGDVNSNDSQWLPHEFTTLLALPSWKEWLRLLLFLVDGSLTLHRSGCCLSVGSAGIHPYSTPLE